MANITIPKESPPVTIDKFLGINENTASDTQLKLGEASVMQNIRLTENFKLKKRSGYKQLFATLGDHDIQGMWHGKLGGNELFVFSCNGTLYSCDLTDGTNTSIGTVTDAKTSFFQFADKLYILNGTDYKSYDGTNLVDVSGYIPKVATATPPAGGGTDNEQINLLTGKKHQTFSGDATATAYQVRETDITSIDKVYVDGTLLTVTTDYTVDLTNGQVIPVTASDFTLGVDNIDIYWTKGSGSRSDVTAHKFAMFYGGQNDTRVFIYGDGTNRYRYSGLADGVPSAEYFPALNYQDISSSEFAVTKIIRQYDRQLIHTNGGETWYSYYTTITLDNGDVVPDFPVFPLNGTVGNIAMGQGELILNNPFSIQQGIFEWKATNVRDERNAQYISERVQSSLNDEDLTLALTVDWEARQEYWLAIDNKVWVYNYRLDVWYKHLLHDNVTCFLVVDDLLYFGTDAGQIMKFDTTLANDNGNDITCLWEMGFYAFDAEYLEKYMNDMWISLKPENKSSVSITYETDRIAKSNTYKATYNLATFENMDFGKFSFLVNYNPQPFHFKVRAKRFVYFKLLLTNVSDDELLTVLSIDLPVRYGGKVK